MCERLRSLAALALLVVGSAVLTAAGVIYVDPPEDM